MFTTIINTASDLNAEHYATDEELAFLDQIIDLDGEDAVVVGSEPLLNGSRRRCGVRMTITDEAWDAVQQAIAATEEEK